MTDDAFNPIAVLTQPLCEVKDIQRIFSISKNSAYAAVQRGEFESIRIGGRIKIITAPLRRRLGLDAPVSVDETGVRAG